MSAEPKGSVSDSRRWPWYLAFLTLGLLVARFADPNAWFPYPPCPLYEVTGLHCPLCGAGRGVHALLHGEIIQAFAFNALFTFVVFVFIAQMAWRASIAVASDEPLPPWRWPRWSIVLTIAVSIVFGILRNFEAFAYLAPHVL